MDDKFLADTFESINSVLQGHRLQLSALKETVKLQVELNKKLIDRIAALEDMHDMEAELERRKEDG